VAAEGGDDDGAVSAAMNLIQESAAEMVFEEDYRMWAPVFLLSWIPFGWVLHRNPDLWTYLLFVLVVVFMCVLLPLRMMWYEKITLDLQSRTFEIRRGLWPFLGTTSGGFSGIEGIGLRTYWEHSSSDGPSSKKWGIDLLITAMRKNPQLGEYDEEAKAREDFERYAAVLKLPAHDRTGPTERVTRRKSGSGT